MQAKLKESSQVLEPNSCQVPSKVHQFDVSWLNGYIKGNVTRFQVARIQKAEACPRELHAQVVLIDTSASAQVQASQSLWNLASKVKLQVASALVYLGIKREIISVNASKQESKVVYR